MIKWWECTEEDEIIAKKMKPKERNWILSIAVPNNAIRINCIKVKIDNIHHDCKCKLCEDRDETVNHTISECSKFTQKVYQSRHDWMGKVIH